MNLAILVLLIPVWGGTSDPPSEKCVLYKPNREFADCYLNDSWAFEDMCVVVDCLEGCAPYLSECPAKALQVLYQDRCKPLMSWEFERGYMFLECEPLVALMPLDKARAALTQP